MFAKTMFAQLRTGLTPYRWAKPADIRLHRFRAVL